MFYINDGSFQIFSRNGNDVTDQFPELKIPEEAFRVQNAVFDGEIVCLDKDGKPVFKEVIRRLMSKRNFEIEARKRPVVVYLFDCLYLDGRSLLLDPIERRYAWLVDSVRKDTPYRLSEYVDDGEALFDAARLLGVEGIMAKRKGSTYQPDKRSSDWVKVKVKNEIKCAIIGFTLSASDERFGFGSLHLAENANNEWIYRGRVGTGFTDHQLKEMRQRLDELRHPMKFDHLEVHDAKSFIPVRPVLSCEVEYSELTDNGTLRDPVFKRLADSDENG